MLLMLVGVFVLMNHRGQAQDILVKDAKIIFLGDSITQSGVQPNGYVTIVKQQIEKNYPNKNIEVVGAGISGNKVPDLQQRLQKDVLDAKPTCVVIYIGINDVWHSQSGRGTPKEEFENGLSEIIEKIKDVGAKVILCTPSVIGERVKKTNSLDKMLADYSAASRKLARKTDVKLLDLRRKILNHLRATNPLDREKNILTTDGVHLNAAGNAFVAQQMLRALGHRDYLARRARTVMQHIVLFKFKESVSQDDIKEIEEAFSGLKDSIDEIIGYEAGTNVSPEQLDQGFTHAFVVTFRDAAGRDKYLPHPAHKQFVKLLAGKIDDVLVVDFESAR